MKSLDVVIPVHSCLRFFGQSHVGNLLNFSPCLINNDNTLLLISILSLYFSVHASHIFIFDDEALCCYSPLSFSMQVILLKRKFINSFFNLGK